MGERIAAYRVWVKKPEGKTKRRLEDNIKMDFSQAGCGCMNWIDLTQDSDRWQAFVNEVMNFRVP
jgi:hypothetical protein